MIVYHGSNHLFSKLSIYNRKRIDERVQAQGPGIYFTTEYNDAFHHGRYVYELDVPDDVFCAYSYDVLVNYFNKACDYIQNFTNVDLRLYVPLLFDNYNWEISGLSEYLYGKMRMYLAFRCLGDTRYLGMNNIMERIVVECTHTVNEFTITQLKLLLKFARKFDKWAPKVYLFKSDVGVIKTTDAVFIRSIHFSDDLRFRMFDKCQYLPSQKLVAEKSEIYG